MTAKGYLYLGEPTARHRKACMKNTLQGSTCLSATALVNGLLIILHESLQLSLEVGLLGLIAALGCLPAGGLGRLATVLLRQHGVLTNLGVDLKAWDTPRNVQISI